MTIYKHKVLYYFLSTIEAILVTLIETFLIIYVIGEPIGDYTLKIFLLKIVAMVVFFAIAKFEGGE